MFKPEAINPQDFDYDLPAEKIAQFPLAERSGSKLLVYKGGTISDRIFSELPSILPQGSFLVFNETKVIQARLHFEKATGAKIEIFCLGPHDPLDYSLSLSSRQHCEWKCLVGNAKRWKEGILKKSVTLLDQVVELQAERVREDQDCVIVRFSWSLKEISFGEILACCGEVPLPPYLNRHAEAQDKLRYQTVYARAEGSVAAPTAGLHFTEEVMQEVQQRGMITGRVCLHVGAGTFKPVLAETIRKHVMHSEYFEVERNLIEQLLQYEGPVVAVGTTSVRSLESLYLIGQYCYVHGVLPAQVPQVEQWMWEEYPGISRKQSLQAILECLDREKIRHYHATTQIMIVPGYRFGLTDVLVTNFHQPRSTLLMLISAFVGEDWKKIYGYALEKKFRFLSYGDSSILFPSNSARILNT